MTHQMVLALFVLTGVFTRDELKLFLKDTEDKIIPYNATWEYYVDEVEAWKKEKR